MIHKLVASERSEAIQFELISLLTRLSQSKFTVGGFYFVTPEIAVKLVEEAGLRVVRRSDARGDTSGNTYYDRDFLFVVERDDMPEQKNTPTKPSTFFK